MLLPLVLCCYSFFTDDFEILQEVMEVAVEIMEVDPADTTAIMVEVVTTAAAVLHLMEVETDMEVVPAVDITVKVE